MEAGLKLDTQEVVTGGSKVRFHHHNILLPDTADTADQGVKKRAGKGHDGTDTAEAVEDITPSKSVGTKDPIKWFGVLSPPALKQSQVGIAEIQYLQVNSLKYFVQASFKTATELSVDCANIQSEMAGVMNRVKFVRRMLHKSKASADTQAIETLDSSFRDSVKI